MLTESQRVMIERAVLLGGSAALAAAYAADVGGAVQAAAAALFFLVCPGLALLAPARFALGVELALLCAGEPGRDGAGVGGPVLHRILVRSTGRRRAHRWCAHRCPVHLEAANRDGDDDGGDCGAMTAAASSNYERFVSGGSVAPVLLILALLVQWQLLGMADPRVSGLVRPVIGCVVVPLSVLVAALTRDPRDQLGDVKPRKAGRTVGLDDIAPRAVGAGAGGDAGAGTGGAAEAAVPGNPLDGALAGIRRAMVDQPGAWVWRYLLAFGATEVAGLLFGRAAGSVLYAVLCFTLINHHLALVLGWGPDSGPRTALGRPPVLLVLAVLAASRLGAMSTAVFDPAWYGGYAVAAIPLAAGLIYLHRTDPAARPHLGRLDNRQAGIAALGVPLAALAFAATMPRTELDHWDLGAAVYLGVALFALGGAAEELLYRGLLQPLFGHLLGTSGILPTTLLYAATHADLNPGTLVVLVGANVAFGQQARRTGSLTGVCIAHAVLNVLLALVLPYWWPH